MGDMKKRSKEGSKEEKKGGGERNKRKVLYVGVARNPHVLYVSFFFPLSYRVVSHRTRIVLPRLHHLLVVCSSVFLLYVDRFAAFFLFHLRSWVALPPFLSVLLFLSLSLPFTHPLLCVTAHDIYLSRLFFSFCIAQNPPHST